MSCVAEPKATESAPQTTGCKATRGSLKDIATSPAITASCASKSQLRRRPSQRVSNGIGNQSTSGAQTHLKA